MNRILLLSDPVFHAKNITLKHFDKKRKKISRTNNLGNNKESIKFISRFINRSWFTVSYASILTEKFKQFNRNDIKVSYYSTNKLKNFIKVHKEPLNSFSKSNDAYKINCNDCDASYLSLICLCGTKGEEAENSDFRISKSYMLEQF